MAARVKLRRPTEADVAEMLAVQRSAFAGNALNDRCFPDDPSPAATQVELGTICKNLPQITLAVSDDDQGRILGWARWVRRPAPMTDASSSSMPVRTIIAPESYPANGDPDFAARYFQANADNTTDIVGHTSYWFLSTLVVRSDEQGKGVGSMLVSVGTDAADEEGWAAYLNASPVARPLYERFGFKTVRTSWFTADIISYHMLRDAESERRENVSG